MPRRARNDSSYAPNGTNVGIEKKLRRAAYAVRNNMDAAEHKHVVHGLIFLKDISEALGGMTSTTTARRTLEVSR